MSRISTVQQGTIVENEFAKILILTSGGQLEPSRPYSDEERRDYDIHIKHDFLRYAAFQLKSSLRLSPKGLLKIQINARPRAVQTDPRYWYFMAHFDVKRMGFEDPVFLVPSKVMHATGRPWKGRMLFMFQGSMKPDTKDMWRPYGYCKRTWAREFSR